MAKKVLVIDDDKVFLQEVSEILNLSGYDVTKAHDPKMALEIATKVRPDIVLLDLKMPRMSGFQFADKLKRAFQDLQVPVVAMTGCLGEDHSKLLLLCGITRCLKKPFSWIDMVTKIETTLAKEVHQ